MPIYEYHCAKCDQTIEVIQKMSDKPLKKHEGCGGMLTKLNSAAGFQFKGTGWYVTDYARKSSGEKTETATETKTESKGTYEWQQGKQFRLVQRRHGSDRRDENREKQLL